VSVGWPRRRKLNVVVDGFADNLAKENNSLVHYLLSNPAYDLIVQMFL